MGRLLFYGESPSFRGVLKAWNHDVFGDVRIKKQEALGRIKLDGLKEEGLLNEDSREEN